MPVPPHRHRARTGCAVGAALAGGLLLAGCSSSPAAPGGAAPATTPVAVAISDAGCQANPQSVPAGPATFTVTNSGSAAVTEAELQSDGKILGERENITPGLDGTFSLRLDPGQYSIYCPGAKQDTWSFTVTGAGGAPAPAGPANTSLADASTRYRDYVNSEIVLLESGTRTFTNAVRSGDIAAAEAAYAPARLHYESIEPVAESFGNLDPDIDARIDDVADPARWTGFHRLEKALWVDRSLAGMTPIANKLDADVAALKSKAAATTYQPAELANGASDLLTEVSTTKATGEEDRYSHTDLWDFAANIAGAREAFELLRPALAQKDPALAQQLQARFTDVTQQLDAFKRGTGYASYTSVDKASRRKLSDAVNALAEPLSQVAGKVV